MDIRSFSARTTGRRATAVVVVNYNTREALRQCLDAVRAETSDEVVVADNGSTDGSVEMVRKGFSDVTIHVDSSNPGYGAAANAGIAACSAPYIVLLNGDTVVMPGAIEALGDYLQANPRAAVVGPRLLNHDGTLQRSCYQFPTPLALLLHYSVLGDLVCHVPGLRRLYLGSFAHDRVRVVPWVKGAALAIQRSAFETVGGFDPSFFMYYEEVDLAYRLRVRGWETHFAPVADVIHLGGASTQEASAEWFVEQLRSALHFARRHYSRRRVRQTAFVLWLAVVHKLVADTARYRQIRDPAQRGRLADNISRWRGILGEPSRLASGPLRSARWPPA